MSKIMILANPIPKDIFKKLMLLSTQEIFMHKGQFYKQIDGYIMGSPLGPTLANFFPGTFRTKVL